MEPPPGGSKGNPQGREDLHAPHPRGEAPLPGTAGPGDTVILQDAEGGGDRTVQLSKLTAADRKLLVKGVLRTDDQDHEEFLRGMRERLDRAGIPIPMVEVRWENLHIDASAYVGSRALPSVLNSYINFFESILLKLRVLGGTKKPFTILDNMSGVLKPGRMCLLLGPPSSGKSTLLQTLAGKFHANKLLEVKGKVTYNGRPFSEFVPVRTASYVTQYDVHMAELTVRETLDFARRCNGSGASGKQIKALMAAEGGTSTGNEAVDAYLRQVAIEGGSTNVFTDMNINILGLEVCADIPVGSQVIRGISGGQKKRVTTGEMLVGPQKVLFMDEISTGLDSSTTNQIVKAMRDVAHLQGATILMALLQPAPEVFELFDDVLLMSEGRTIYHGPIAQVEPFFEGLGFRCPPRKGLADFLQEVTSAKDQEQYWTQPQPWQFVPGDTFVEAFSRSGPGQNAAAHLAQPYDDSQHHEDALVTERYAIQGMNALKATTDREMILLSRTFFVYIFKAVQMAFVALITAFMFFRTHIHDYTIQDASLIAGLLFFTPIMSVFAGLAEMTFAVERLPTFFKHRDNNYFPSWTFVIPTTLTRLPASLVETFAWTIIVYFIAPLDINAGRFFMFWLQLLLLHNLSTTIFRMVGALCRNLVIANAMGSFLMLLVLMTGGFIIPKQAIHPWVIWLYWSNPLQWTQRAFLINEFAEGRWDQHLAPGGDGRTLGQQELFIRGLPHKYWWCWAAVGVNIFANVIVHVILIACATFLSPAGGSANLQTDESLAAREYAKHGGPGGPTGSRKFSVDEKQRSQRLIALQELEKQISRKHMGGSSKNMVGGTGSSRRMSTKRLGVENTTNGAAAADANGGSMKGNTVAPLDDEIPEDRPTSFRDGSFKAGSAKGMALPFNTMTMTFRNLCYWVACPPEMVGKDHAQVMDKGGKPMLQLLFHITAAFRPGVLTCLMGVSGAGKTTLMDVLAGRKTGGIIEGDIRVNGHPKEHRTFARVSGYCEQFDIHSPRATVVEALMFSCRMRFNEEISNAAAQAFVDEVLDLVELQPNRDSLVGEPGVDGLSVEQRKRLTIAVELVANPSIIFMDEPTSGLDSRAAQIIMRAVRNIVNTQRTIVCTIHQPSIDIFESFDELLLLRSGGRTIYAGPTGTDSLELIKYFQNIQGVAPIPEGFNPATWMLQVTTPGSAARTGVDFADLYDNSSLAKNMDGIVSKAEQPDPEVSPLAFSRQYPRTWLRQYLVCLWKFNATYWRNPEYNGTRFTFSLAVAVGVGFCFWFLGGKHDTEGDIYSTLGALLTASLFLGILNAIFVQPVIGSEREVFYRERAAGMYEVEPWYLALASIEFMYLVLQTVLYVCVVYFACNFYRGPEQFFWFLLYNLLSLGYWTYYGVAAVAVTPNLLMAAIISGAFYGLSNLFSGFVLPRPNFPGWFLWLYYLDPVSWTLYGLVTSNLGKEDDAVIMHYDGTTNTVPQFLKQEFRYRHQYLGYVVLILAAFVAFFWTAGALSFKYLNFNKR